MRLGPLAFAAALVAGLSAPAAAPAAEALFGVTTTNTLVTFASDSPGMVRTAVPVTGLQPSEQLIGLDVRPATGQLYALGSSNRLYVINTLSGAARTAGGEAFSPQLAGTSFGFDFNPVADRARLSSDGRQNLRLNPEDGAVSAQDNQLAYVAGDPGENSNPHVGAVAYTAGPDSKLFGLETARDALVLVSPPNDGKLTTVGGLGVDMGEPTSFDIAADGRAFVAGARAGGTSPELFTVDLAKGGLAAAGLLSRISTTYGDVRAIAAAGVVPDDRTRPSALVAVDSRQPRNVLRSKLVVPVSCSEACTISATLRQGREIAGSGAASLAQAGNTRVRVQTNKRGKRLAVERKGVVKPKAAKLTLRVQVLDSAGNSRTISRKLTFE